MPARLMSSIATTALLASCSMKFSHPDGSATYLGVVNLHEGTAGDAPFIHSRRYGVMLDAGVANNGVAVGYDDRMLVKPTADAITTLEYDGSSAPDYRTTAAR